MTYGEEKPWVAGASQESYGKNRRAEFRLMRGDVRLVLDEGVYYDDRANVISKK